MIGPQKLERAPVEVVKLMNRLQDWTITEIAGRIARSAEGIITPTAAHMLTTLYDQRLFDRDFKRELQKILNLSEKEIDALYRDAAKANYLYDKRAFAARGIPLVPFEDNYFLQQMTQGIIDVTQGEMKNITGSLGFAERVAGSVQFKPVARFYQDELNLAVAKVATGTASFEEALGQAVTKMADSGLRAVDYASGRSDRIDVAVRRAVMGGMRDLTDRQSEYNAGVMGVTTYEISWHGGHRPSHGWGGRRFDTTGALYPTEEDLYSQYGGGRLDDYNCYHEKYAVFPDAPVTFTDEELEQMEAEELRPRAFMGKEYTAYEARQQQRNIERSIREQRLRVAGYKAAGVPEKLAAAKIRLNRKTALYKSFSSAMELRTEFERVNTGL